MSSSTSGPSINRSERTSLPQFASSFSNISKNGLILFETEKYLASVSQHIMQLEEPFVVAIGKSGAVFTHQLGGNVFGDQQSLRKYQNIMGSIEKEWPALSKLINAQQPNSRIAVFTNSYCNDILQEKRAGGSWGPFSSSEPRLKQFNAGIVVDVNRGKLSIEYVGHEWWHEIQSINHAVKSGRSPCDLPISMSTYLNAADEFEVVVCWYEGYEKYCSASASLPSKDPRHLIYGRPASHYAKFQRFECQAGCQAEAAAAWAEFTDEIGTYMVSARLEHGHQAIQEHAPELGQLIDKKLGMKAFTESCPKKFKTQLLSAIKRNTGRALLALGWGLDVYHEHTQLPDTQPNKSAHALINGTVHNLVGQVIFSTSLNESLLYDTTSMGSGAKAVQHIEDLVGKDRLQKILIKGNQARYRENECLPMNGDEFLIGEEREIYFSYMNACSRNFQESIQEPITQAYDTVKQSIQEPITQAYNTVKQSIQEPITKVYNAVKQSIGEIITSCSPSPETFQKVVNTLRTKIKAELITRNILDPAQPEMAKKEAEAKLPRNESLDIKQTSDPKEQLFRRWMNDFQNNNVATMNISIQGISEDVLKSDKPLTEEQIKIIQAELDFTEKQILPKLKEAGQIGEELGKELTAKCDEQNKGEYFQKISEAAAKLSASLYMGSQRRLAQKRFDTEHEQAQMEFDRREKRSKALHYQEVTEISFSSIEMNVWNVLHPSGNFRQSLTDMARNVDICGQREKEIRTLIHEKTEIKKGLDRQDIRLNPISTKIKRKYGELIHARTSAIKKQDRAQKALGVISSFFSLAAAIPSLTPIALGAAALTDTASHVVGIGSAHQEKRRMRTEFKFRNEREHLQNISDGLAKQAYQQTSDIYHLEQEEIHLRRERSQIMESNIAIDPAKHRKQLDKDQVVIDKAVKKTQQAIQKNDNSKQEQQKVIDKCKENLDNNATQAKIEEIRTAIADSLKQDIKEHPEKLLRGRGTSTKVLRGSGTSVKGLKKGGKSKKRKKHKTKPKPTEETKPKSTLELTKELLYYTALAESDTTSTQLKLAEAQSELSQLQSESLNLGSHLTSLTKEQKENQGKIEREAKLATLKDRFYQSINSELNKYDPIDFKDEEEQKDFEELKKYLDKAFEGHHSVRGNVRAAASGLFGASAGLFQEFSDTPVLRGLLEAFTPFLSEKVKGSIVRVPIYFQYITKLGEQTYKLYDAYDNLKLAHNALGDIRAKEVQNPSDTFAKAEKMFMNSFGWLESDRIKNPFQMLNNDQAIKQFGALRYVNEVLVPAINIATSTLACVRIMNHIAHGCPRTLSPEEMKLDKIQEFLIEFSEHLDKKFLVTLNYLGKSHQDVIDNINIMRSELGIVASELAAEIDYARNQILNKQEEINYNDHTVRIKATGIKISKARTELELSTQIAPTTREGILEFFKKINVSLKHDSVSDINTGLTVSHGANVNPLVNIQNATKNPDMYTGLIAFKAQFPKQLSSLYLFNLIYQNYQYGLKLAEPHLKNSDEPLSTLIKDCASLLEIQGRALNEFCGKVDVMISNCRITQDESLKSLQQQLNSVCSEKQHYMQHTILQERKRYSTLISNDIHYVGAQKFHFAESFCTTLMVETAKPQTYGAVKQFARETGTTTVINGVQTFFGVALLGPGYFGIGAIGQVWSLVKGTNAATEYSISENLKKRYDDSTLLSQLDRQVSTEPEPARSFISYIIPEEKLIMTVWLAENGKLCSKISRIGGSVFSKTNLNSSTKNYEASKGKTSFEISYRLLGKNIKVISNTSSIKVDEVQKLDPKHHLPNKAKYDAALKKLLGDYEAWLEPNSQIKEDNQFHPIKDNSQFLRSNDLSTVPLAFPKELLQELENRMDPDRILMEAADIGFLEPSYSFTKDSNGDGYTLRVQYHFIDNANRTERKLYEEFDVAYVDENTVKSFAKPSFSNVQKTNSPNLNELLIQLIYTNKELGAPGDRSVSLGENRWVAPSMRAFPGLYKLWRHYPDCAIHFNSKYYTEDMSFCLMMCANGKLKTAKSSAAQEAKELIKSMLKRSRSTKTGVNVSIWKRIRESKEDLSETKRLLAENYNLLIAYCRLISCLDEHSLRQKLENDFGILDPSNFNSLYDLIAGGIILPTVEDKALEYFKIILQLIPSKYLALINPDIRAIPITEGTAEPKPSSPKPPSSTPMSRPSTSQLPPGTAQPKPPAPKTSSPTPMNRPSTSQLPPDTGIDIGSPLENRYDEGYLYSGTDIEIVRTFLFKDEDSVNLLSPMNPVELAKCSKQIQEKLADGKPLMFIYNPSGGHYVAVAVIQTGVKQVKILCKDSMGVADYKSLNIFPQDYTVSSISNTKIEQSEPGDVGCGIYALDNLRTMIHHLKNSGIKETFITNFAEFKEFCSNIKVKDLRKNEFAVAYQKGQRLIEKRDTKSKNVRPLITAHHQTEIDAIAAKIRQAFPSRVVKSVKADDEITKSKHTNTIFVDFALRSNTIANKSYDYVYRIYPSNEISLNDLKTTVSALGLPEGAYEIEQTLDKIVENVSHYHYVIKISSDSAAKLGIIANEKYTFENNHSQEGVNLVGECPTNGNKIYIAHGYAEIDLTRAAHHSKCPCCQKNAVNIKEIFFKNCNWETTTFDSEGNSTETKGTGSHTLNLSAVEFVEFKAKKIV